MERGQGDQTFNRRISTLDLFDDSFSSIIPFDEKEDAQYQATPYTCVPGTPVAVCADCILFIGDLLQLPNSKIQRHAFVFHGRPQSEVHILGFVTKAVAYGDCCAYTVDDGTGSILCRFYFDESNFEEPEAVKLVDGVIPEGTLVHLCGRTVIQRGIKTVVIKLLRILEDLNSEAKHTQYTDWLYKTRYGISDDMRGQDRIRKLSMKPERERQPYLSCE